ncbi:hypothetical protein SBC1_27580 [Caballeronia sp. SBC1]|nr:hypothetical protein SBC2_27730 [Caballeronia sp. SBC2]QIN62742.1 hypothetical protein SBC1_27580 [Caballeronia sp. SBC1]
MGVNVNCTENCSHKFDQYYDFARELVDRYWVMSRGEIVAGDVSTEMEAHGARELIAD